MEELETPPQELTQEPDQPQPLTELSPPVELSMDELLEAGPVPISLPVSIEDAQLKAMLEAIVYVAEEPVTIAQIAAALQQPAERVGALLAELTAEFEKPEHGLAVREVAGGFKLATKPEHHEAWEHLRPEIEWRARHQHPQVTRRGD